jgi:very-short-patch-repair endonuclease
MRANATPTERLLWEELRAKKLGVKFRRQAIILGWIVDFYCPAQGLVVEVDGLDHQRPLKKAKDAERDKVMRARGLRILRIDSSRVLSQMPSVLEEIRQMVQD